METLRFEILTSPLSVRGCLRYVREDYAFNFRMDVGEQERFGKGSTTSFVVNTLQLEVAVDSSLCLYVWGYCPMGRWEQSLLSPPIGQTGSLRASHGKPLEHGVAVGLEQMMPATAWFDPDSGWFCIGNKESAAGVESVEFATGCLAVIVGGRLSSLWIKPENWKDMAESFLKQKRRASDIEISRPASS